MSLTGAFVIAALCIVRIFLKKAPKIISYCLWAVAGFRLLFPFSVESIFSLIPFKTQMIPMDIATQQAPRINSGISFMNNAVSDVLPKAASSTGVNPLNMWMTISSYIWFAGVVIMLIYGIVSFFILKRKMRESIQIEENVYESENIKSPFVLGIFKPKIYLPINLSEGEKKYIILHEQTHIHRHDHIVKFVAYFILCLHWFNPLAWISFILMGADMEMSCDESVLREMGDETKKDYSMSLLSFATNRRIINGSPLSFGEGGIKERIKNVLNFKKASRLVIIVSVALVAIISLGFAVNKAFKEPLIKMEIIYKKNPAHLFSDIQLIWNETVYYNIDSTWSKPINRGNEIGYAHDENGTDWRIFELKGYFRDYLIIYEKENMQVSRLMHVNPNNPFKTYILENATEKQRYESMLSISLYHDGTARLATSPFSSYALLNPCYYSFTNGELLIHYEPDNLIARFEVVDDNTLIFTESYVPLRAMKGSRYVSDSTDISNDMISSDIYGKIYLGMTHSEVEEILGKRDGEGSGLDFWMYNDVGSIYFGLNFHEDSGQYKYDEAIVTRINFGDRIWDINDLVSTAVKQHNANIPSGEFASESHINLEIDASSDNFTIYVISLYERFMPEGEYDVNLISSVHTPLALTFEKNASGDYELKEYWQPKDGNEYTSSIHSKFPENIWHRTDMKNYIEAQKQRCYNDAMYFFVGAIPLDRNYGIGQRKVTVTDVAEDIYTNECFMIKYFPGARLKIEGYEGESLDYKSENLIIEYTDSSKNLRIDKSSIDEIQISDDLIGIYNLDSKQYVMKFEKYVKVQ